MEELFQLVEKITGALKARLSTNRDQIGVFNFEKAIITNSSFEITFASIECSIKLSLNTHHLEIPWSVQVFINAENLNSLISKVRSNDLVFEVYPNLLKDPNDLGLCLAREIGDNIVEYLKTNTV